ncbi:MAG: S8 family serine peptidase [bacterium]|nr:S8 family serine peptidase [bacterium]
MIVNKKKQIPAEVSVCEFMLHDSAKNYKAFKRIAKKEKEVVQWPKTTLHEKIKGIDAKGEGVLIGVVSTGFDVNHIDLKGAVSKYKDFTGEGIDDRNGQGNHILGILCAQKNGVGLIGMAYKSKLVIAKGLNNNGEGTIKSVTESIDWLVAEGVHIIQLAFSASKPSNELYRSVHRALAAGVIIVAEAGTEDSIFATGPQAPGAYRGVYTVAALDENGNPCDFSKEGHSIDCGAPALEVWSLSRDGGYAQLSGGFVAAALVTGFLALLKAKHLQSPDKDNPLDNCDDAHRVLRPMSKHPDRHDSRDGFGLLLVFKGFAGILKKMARKIVKIIAKMVKDSSIT